MFHLFKSNVETKLEEPDKEPLFTFEILGVGTTYNSWKKPKKTRTSLLDSMHNGDSVYFEKNKFEGKPLFLINNIGGIDICSLSLGVTEYLIEMVDGLELRGTLIDNEAPTFEVRVYGTFKKEYPIIDPPKTKHEYTYSLDNPDEELFLLPVGVEMECKLVEFEAGYLVKQKKAILAIISDKRVEKLKNMVDSYDCITTVYNKLTPYGTRLHMVLRF